MGSNSNDVESKSYSRFEVAASIQFQTICVQQRYHHKEAIQVSFGLVRYDRRRNILQQEAASKHDSELPELQEDLDTVNYICRYSNWKETGDRDLKLITWKTKECDICCVADKDARFFTLEAAAEKGEDLCPHAFCWDCATAHVFGAAAISARTKQYQRTPLARCPVCNVEVTGVVKIEFKADSGM